MLCVTYTCQDFTVCGTPAVISSLNIYVIMAFTKCLFRIRPQLGRNAISCRLAGLFLGEDRALTNPLNS